MNIYIAAPYSCREDAELLAQRLRTASLNIISTWHLPTNQAPTALITDEQTACRLYHAAQDNIRQLKQADALILIEYSQSGAGCYWETGYAHRMGIPVHVIQPQRCIYNLLAAQTWTRDEIDVMIQQLTHSAAALTLKASTDENLSRN